jgi:hypothetical protein
VNLAALSAGLVAAGLSLIEVASSRVGLAPRATHWVLVRLLIDGALGFTAYFPVSAAASTTLPSAIVILLSGAAGTSALRSYCVRVGKGAGARQVGLVATYEKVRAFTDSKISAAVALAKTSWIRQKAEPALRHMSCTEVMNDVCSYLDFHGMNPTRIAKLRSSFELALGDNPHDPEARIYLYRVIISSGAYYPLRAKVAEAKKRGSSIQ